MNKKSYIICSTGRTGSTLLARTLAGLGYAGNPKEYWHWRRRPKINDSEDFKDCLAKILKEGTTSNKVFGIKMHWRQFQNFINKGRQYLALTNKTDFALVEG